MCQDGKKVYEFIKYRRTKHDLLGVGALLGASSISLKISSEHISPCSDIVVQEVFKRIQGATRGCLGCVDRENKKDINKSKFQS